MPGATGGCIPRLIAGGVSEGHLDRARWEGGVAQWFYEAVLKEDKMNIVCAQLMCMAGTVEASD